MQIRKMQLRSSIKIALLAVAIAFGFVLYANPALAAEGVDNAIDAKVEIELSEANVKPDNLIEEDTVKVAPNSDYTKVNIHYKKCSTDNTNNTNNKQNNKTEKAAGKKAIAPTGDTATKTAVVVGLSLVGILSVIKGRDLKKTLGALVVVLGLAAISTAPCAYATNTTHKIGDVVKLDAKSNQEITYKVPEIEGYEVMGYTIESNPFTIKYIDAFDEANPQVLAEYKAELNEATPECDKAMPEHAGFKFSGWEPQVDKTVTKNCEYKAQWDVSTCKVSATSNELGKVAVDNIVVKHGGSAKVTFAANEDSKLVKVLVNDSEIDLTEIKDDTLKLGNITQDTAVKAEFALKLTPVVPIPNVNTELIEVKVGTEITNDTYLNAVKLADDATDSIKSVELVGEGIDTSKINKGSVEVKVTFESGSSRIVDINYEVKPFVCTVTYKDGLDGEVFEDQVDKINYGEKTPKFNGEHNREGYKFDGWEPEVEDAVTKDVTYTAKWIKVHTVTINLATRRAFGLDDNYDFIDDQKAKANNKKTKEQWRDAKQKEYSKYIDLNSLDFKINGVSQEVTRKDLNEDGQLLLSVEDGAQISLGTPEMSRYFSFDKWDYDFNKPITKDIVINGTWDDTWYFYMDENTGEGTITLDKPDSSLNAVSCPKRMPQSIRTMKCVKPIILYNGGPIFDECSNLKNISALKDWDTSNVTDMTTMFYQCSSLSDISGLKNWDTFQVTSMYSMFNQCSSLSDISALENWDTSQVTSMYSMFNQCSKLSDISGLKNWDTSNVTDMMTNMFYQCSSLSDISALENWDTSQVTNMSFVFSECSSLSDISALENWDTSQVTNMTYMFSQCSSLSDISALAKWNTSNVTYMGEMFNQCSSLSDISALAKWNTSNVTYMGEMFNQCSSLSDISALAEWNTSNVTYMGGMFNQCSSLSDISALENWKTSQVTNMREMFKDSNIKNLSALENWETSQVTDKHDMFENVSDSVKRPSWYNEMSRC